MGGHPTRSGVNRCYMVLLSILLGEFRSPRILASVCGGWPNHQPVKAVASCAGLLFVAFALGPWEQNCPSPRKPLDDMLTVSRYETMEISWKYHVDICRLQREVPGSRPHIRNPPALALRYYSCTVYSHFTHRNRFQSESSGCQGRPCFPHEPMS